jgi:hypothetical protein
VDNSHYSGFQISSSADHSFQRDALGRVSHVTLIRVLLIVDLSLEIYFNLEFFDLAADSGCCAAAAVGVSDSYPDCSLRVFEVHLGGTSGIMDSWSGV